MRAIDWDKPLSEDDLLWLGQRMTPELKAKIEANQAKFADTEEEDEDAKGEADSEPDDDYDDWKRDDLKAEAENREGLDVTGLTKKADLIAALRTWDAAHPDAAEA